MMRQRLAARGGKRGQGGGATVRDINVPLPLRGVYAKARAAQVSNLYASELLNLRSNGVSLTLRPGVEWVTRLASEVFQRIPFEFGGSSFYIEVSPTMIRADGKTALREVPKPMAWATNSGNVIMADGAGLPLRFDGTAFAEAAFTVESGLSPAECDGIQAHHDRIYLWKTGGALEFLVGDVGAVQGVMSKFPLGRLGNITGSIQTMVSLTIDAGHGMNDVLIIITTTGQIIAYEGFDPTDASDWRLLGRVKGAVPLGPRAVVQVGSDAWMITAQGPVSIGQAMRESVLALVSDVAQPIADDIARLAEAGGGTWQAFGADDGSMIVLNHVKDGVARQFIYWTEGRAWGTADMQAADFHNISGRPEVTGFDGKLGRLWRDGKDELITACWVSSWFEVGGAAVKYIEPTIISHGPMTIRVVVLSDRNDTAADISEAEQTITITPEESAARVTLSEIIPTDASGRSFQITLEVTARWAEITGLMAGIGS